MAVTVVVLFTGIVGSTDLQTRLGDDAFDALRRAHFEILEREVTGNGGEVVKRLGDGVMAAFGGASDAARAGTEIEVARRAAERVGMPGWIDRLDALAAGDPEPWRIGIPD